MHGRGETESVERTTADDERRKGGDRTSVCVAVLLWRNLFHFWEDLWVLVLPSASYTCSSLSLSTTPKFLEFLNDLDNSTRFLNQTILSYLLVRHHASPSRIFSVDHVW